MLWRKHVHLLLNRRKGKKHYVLIKDFNTIVYDHTRGKKYFCCYYLLAFNTEEILKHRIEGYFKTNSNQRIIMPKKDQYVKLRKIKKRIKSPFIIYADFESILILEDNKKQNPNKSYANKYQKILLAVLDID